MVKVVKCISIYLITIKIVTKMLWYYKRANSWIGRDCGEGTKDFSEEVTSQQKEGRRYFWTTGRAYTKEIMSIEYVHGNGMTVRESWR